MFKFTVKYTDLSGNQRSEDLYFMYTVDELLQWQTMNGSLTNYLERMVNQFNANELVEWLSSFVVGAYGVKSDDDRVFDKSSDYVKQFKDSVPFHTYFQLLLKDRTKAEEFISNVVPTEFKEQIAKELANSKGANVQTLPPST